MAWWSVKIKHRGKFVLYLSGGGGGSSSSSNYNVKDSLNKDKLSLV
jgi:hypothetical protein